MRRKRRQWTDDDLDWLVMDWVAPLLILAVVVGVVLLINMS